MKRFAAVILMSISIAAAAPKDVLILHSYRVGYDWTDELSRGFRSKFADAGEFNLWFEFLDARRNGYPRNETFLRETFATKHAGRHFDLIIACDDEALDFVAHRAGGVFGSPPVVFCGVSESPDPAQFPRNRFTGLIEVFYPEKILALARSLRPGARDLYFVADHTPFSASLDSVFSQAAKSC